MATIGSLAVGSSVYLNVSGKKTEFLIAQQGLPSSLYDDSCNGTWLLMKGIYESRQWHSSKSNSYKDSTIHTYLNGTFLNLFDSDITALIKTVKIPYVNGTGSSAVASGSSGLSAQIFLLSGYEVGWTQSKNRYFPIDGACLSFFSGSGNSDSNRIAYLNGSATYWWLRSPYTSDTARGWRVRTDGNYGYDNCNSSYGIRPALILPSNTMVNSGNEVQGDPMAPKDGHNTNVGNVAYELESAIALVGGVAYELEYGTVLTDGVAMEISFSKPCTVTITGSGNNTYCYLTINAVKHISASTLEVERGTEIVCRIDPNFGTGGKIVLNGQTVAAPATSGAAATYTLTVTRDTDIVLATSSSSPTITITES